MSPPDRDGGPLIPTFNLYGESADLPDVIHCETIEVRSKLHDWELAPHRHARLHQVLFLESGGGAVQIEDERHPLSPMSLANIPAGVVHGYTFTPGTCGLVVTLAAEMLDQSLRPGEGLGGVLSRAATLPAAPAPAATLEQIGTEFAGRDFGRAQILRGLAGVLLGQLARALTGHFAAAEPSLGPARAPALLARFEALIEAQFRAHWSVADYARALAVSPAHLTRLVRAATGQPASALIEARLIREARRELVYTDLPVSRVAYTLGFEDPAYFSRVFTRATGLSPRAFRQSLDGGR